MTIYIISKETGEVVVELPVTASKQEIIKAVYSLPVDYYVVSYGGLYEMDLWEILKNILNLY